MPRDSKKPKPPVYSPPKPYDKEESNLILLRRLARQLMIKDASIVEDLKRTTPVFEEICLPKHCVAEVNEVLENLGEEDIPCAARLFHAHGERTAVNLQTFLLANFFPVHVPASQCRITCIKYEHYFKDWTVALTMVCGKDCKSHDLTVRLHELSLLAEEHDPELSALIQNGHPPLAYLDVFDEPISPSDIIKIAEQTL